MFNPRHGPVFFGVLFHSIPRIGVIAPGQGRELSLIYKPANLIHSFSG